MPHLKNPAIFRQPIDGALDALTNGLFRLPTGGTNFRRIEEDERIVPHPATLTTGESQLRLQAEPCTNPADRILHLAVFIGAEIVDLHTMFRPAGRPGTHHMEDGRDAIADVQIRFPLRTVAEHVEPLGM